jgi:hypothetical protein
VRSLQDEAAHLVLLALLVRLLLQNSSDRRHAIHEVGSVVLQLAIVVSCYRCGGSCSLSKDNDTCNC